MSERLDACLWRAPFACARVVHLQSRHIGAYDRREEASVDVFPAILCPASVRVEICTKIITHSYTIHVRPAILSFASTVHVYYNSKRTAENVHGARFPPRVCAQRRHYSIGGQSKVVLYDPHEHFDKYIVQCSASVLEQLIQGIQRAVRHALPVTEEAI